MGKYDWGAVARIVALTLVAVAFWWLAKYGYAKPPVLGADAPATVFSAGRAEATLARILGPERPHPVSSDENAAVRARIQKEFAALGVKTSTYKAFTCNAWRGFRAVPCATVTDILAEVVPGEGRAIVLLAHYDSVPAGPGASDDESGVSIVLETARALRARGGKSLHPVLAVITDGEEAGLLGAQAFLENPALQGARGRGGECRSARHARPQPSVPDQPRRFQADRSLCEEPSLLRDEFALCRDLSLPAERHRPDVVHQARLQRRSISRSRRTSPTTTRRSTAAPI